MQLLFYLTYPSYFLDEFVTFDVLDSSFNIVKNFYLFFFTIFLLQKLTPTKQRNKPIIINVHRTFISIEVFFPLNTK